MIRAFILSLIRLEKLTFNHKKIRSKRHGIMYHLDGCHKSLLKLYPFLGFDAFLIGVLDFLNFGD